MSSVTTYIETEKKLVPVLRFKEFDNDWKIESLAKMYANIVVGFVGTISKDYCDQEIGIQFVRTLNVKDGWFSNKNLQYVTEEFHNKNKKSQIKNGDILIARVGANMGMVCEVTGLFGEANSANVIIIKSDFKRSSSFYTSYLTSSGGQKQIQSKGAGGAQEVLNISVAKTIMVPNPTLPEQQKIASFLSAVDEKIQQLTKKKALLADYKKGVMQQLFSGQLRFKDENGKAYPDWEEKRLGEIATKASSNIAANTIEENVGEYKLYGASGFLKKIDFFREKEPFISIVKDGAGVGRTLLCDANSSVLGTLDIIKPKVKVVLYFLYLVLNNVRFEKYMVGSTIPHIYYKDYSNEKITIPCIEEQQKIASYLSGIDTKIGALNNQITQNQIFKKGLLQQMFV